ncbi:hypothetical protein [Pedococcus bigeumensis]|uniref:Uncharacterized protein n=1 Tax=Pedococcus bigeumensis TaxID=433644 RepID=A0A502CFU6_9MICO|nr:hypothetical protein [Pedococcus bigeumensis]TPG12595.1 hypothetical protein EAH86_20045 [Pedococcus bigeumensis]
MEDLEEGWQRAGRVVWKDFEANGHRYSIAGGPRGVLLWTQGNAGVDVPSVVLYAVWTALAGRTARTIVVKVRRRRWGPLRFHVLRREFPAGHGLLESVKSVEDEVRRGAI